jgi:uncharacterized integral membrane protein
VIKFLRILSGAYAVYTLLMLLFVIRNFVTFVSSAYSGGYHGSAPLPVSIITFAVIGMVSVGITAFLSYLLAASRHRKAALIIAGVTCIGIPIGTVLGVLTIYALTRPEVASQFHQPSNQSMQRTADRPYA